MDDLDKILNDINGDVQESRDASSSYFSISLKTLKDDEINAPIYVHLGGDKYVMVANKSSDLTESRINKYRSKGLRRVYITRSDYKSYLEDQLNINKKLLLEENVSPEDRLKLISRYTESLFQSEVKKLLLNSGFAGIENNMKTIAEISLCDRETFLFFENFHAEFPNLFGHSYAVAFLAIAISKKAGIDSAKNKYLIGLSGILHDIGIKDLPEFVRYEERLYFTEEEEGLFRDHPEIGRKIVDQIESIPGLVSEVVAQHHEYCDTSGYPLGLKRNEILSLARLICLSNDAINLFFGSGDYVKSSSWGSVNAQLKKNAHRYDPHFLSAFGKLITKI